MGKPLPFWFGFHNNSQDFWSYNELLIDLACSILVKYRTSVFLHGPRLAALARSVRYSLFQVQFNNVSEEESISRGQYYI